MTLLLRNVSPIFGKLVLKQLLLGPGQITKIHEKQKNLQHLSPHYWLEHVGFFRKSAKPSQTLKYFLQQILDLSEERRETFARHKIEKISPGGETEELTPESLKLQNSGSAFLFHGYIF